MCVSDPADGSEALAVMTVPVRPERYYQLMVYVKSRDLAQVEMSDLFQPFLATAAVQEEGQDEAVDPWADSPGGLSGRLHFPDQSGSGGGSTRGWKELKIVFRTEPEIQRAKLYLIFSVYAPAVGKVYFDSVRLTELNSIPSLMEADRLETMAGPNAQYAKRWLSKGVSKRCLATPAGTELSFDLDLPESAALSFEAQPLVRREDVNPARLRYRVAVTRRGETKTVFDRDLGSIQGTRQKVDLSEYGGNQIKLELSVLDSSASTPGPPPTLWMEPVVYGSGRDEKKFNLLIISLESVRTDRLGAYGYRQRPTSPQLDALAATGAVIEDMYVQRANTLTSLASIFTSTYPAYSSTDKLQSVLPPGLSTYTQVLREQGYATGAFHYSCRNIDQGFDEFYAYSDLTMAVGGTHAVWNRVDGYLVNRALTWMDDNLDRPFFAWLFLVAGRDLTYPAINPEDQFPLPGYSGPLSTDPETLSRQEDKIKTQRIRLNPENLDFFNAQYDSRVRATDRQIGRLLDYLDSRGLRRRTLVVVFSDHGTNLLDPGLPPVHTMTVQDPGLHIPLIFSLPGVIPEGVRVPGLAEGIDIFPTIIEILGLRGLTEQAQGRSIWPAIKGETKMARPFVISDLGKPLLCLRTPEWKFLLNREPNPEFYEWAHTYQNDNLGPDTDWTPVKENQLRLLYWVADGWASYAPRTLYHLTDEGGERVNVLDQYPDKAKELEALLLDWEKQYRREVKPGELDPNAIKLLRETGYLPVKR